MGNVPGRAEDSYKTQGVSPNLIPESRKTSKITIWDFLTVVEKFNFSYQLSKLNIRDVIFYRMRTLES